MDSYTSLFACSASVFRAFLFHRLVFEPVTATGDRNDLSMLQETVQDGGGGRHIANQFAPVVKGQIGRHQKVRAFIGPADALAAPALEKGT